MELCHILLSNITINVYQPRKAFDEEKLHELKQSIEHNGLIQPIIVRKIISTGKYEIVAGERRFRACKELEFTSIPAVIIECDDLTSYELALIENIQRENLNPIEEAESYQMLIELYNYSQEEIGTKFGKTRSTISNKLRLLKLPQEVKELVKNRKLSYGHARTLLSFEDQEKIIQLAFETIEQNFSVRELERLARSTHQSKEKKIKQTKQIIGKMECEYLTEKLTHFFETKVNILQKSKNQGTLSIEFYNYEDLERILTLLNITFDE